jgi:hypothetical protein
MSHSSHSSYAAYHHGAASWIGHTIVSAIIHGLIYGMIFHLFRSMSLTGVLITGGVLLAVVAGGYMLWANKSKGKRRFY